MVLDAIRLLNTPPTRAELSLLSKKDDTPTKVGVDVIIHYLKVRA